MYTFTYIPFLIGYTVCLHKKLIKQDLNNVQLTTNGTWSGLIYCMNLLKSLIAYCGF